MFDSKGIYQEDNGNYYVGEFHNNVFDGYRKYIAKKEE
jgi:hypothetical protein